MTTNKPEVGAMSKHTPGPWRLSDENPRIIKKDFRDIGSDSGCLIASTMGRDDSGFYASNKEADANARLIASAPDLLALLKEARSTLEMWKDVAPAVSLCADIGKAIAKATGEEDEIGNRVTIDT